ncbi:hypothetical protein Sjap_018816 [Stephania japonica]|uniref:RNA helicase n=1 Tax=Stephania japonica TaxID=461633 RepID=A0AAP0NNM0_9MAGN
MAFSEESHTFRRRFQGSGHRRPRNPPNFAPPSLSAAPPRFVVELRRSRRGAEKEELERLIEQYISPDDRFLVYQSGFLAAKLFFRVFEAAMDAFVALWSCRLRGEHSLSPHFVFNVGVGECERGLLVERLKGLFRVHVRGLLEGEEVKRWTKRIEVVSDDVKEIKGRLEKGHGLKSALELISMSEGLVAERGLMLKRVGEFKAAMYCILDHLGELGLDECVESDDQIRIFEFRRGEFDWNRIHYLIVRECKRLEVNLPIYGYRRAILRHICYQQAMVLVGETGSGKSTQLAQFLADSGVAAEGAIVCTQPRKIAANSLAKWVGEECNGCYEDSSVVCYPSYSSSQKFNRKVIFMTDNCLLQHYMNDNTLSGISYIIIDEAHERSLNTDLLMSLIKSLLLKRLDMRLIIMSATADATKLSNYFYGCETIHVVGRSFPVDIKYVDETAIGSGSSSVKFPSYVLDVVKIATDIHKTEEEGAILAFLTSQAEVEWASENFKSPDAVALPLHGKLSWEEQDHVFEYYPGKRKVIFSTNLAETSLTIPGVKYVVDPGMVKECNFDPRTGIHVLSVCRISQSSAQQRAGRAGRTEPGKCYRLYSEWEFQSMPTHQQPEIRRVHLGVAALRILALGINNVLGFDFVDAPCPEAIDRAIKNLIQLGAVTTRNNVLELTDCGYHIVRMGIEPRLGKIILDGTHYGLQREAVVLAALMANANSIFCRVGSEDNKFRSDCLKLHFCHPDGDLFTLLSVYKEWEDLPNEKKNIWCWNNSINAKSLRRCKDTVVELEHCLKNELNVIVPSYWYWKPDMSTEHDKNLKRVILSSLAENVAMYSGSDRIGYQVALTGQHVQLHPSCSLLSYGEKPSWVVFGELLSTSHQYLVCVSAIEYDCLSSLSPPPMFDSSLMEMQRLQAAVKTGIGNHILRRFCGKANSCLLHLISHLQTVCKDERINIEVDFMKNEVLFFASSVNMETVSLAINEALEYEKKLLSDECIEKCLYHGGSGSNPSVALLGAGAAIKHLELDKRCLTVEVLHSNAHALHEKEVIKLFEKCTSGICNFQKTASTGQDGQNSERWGKITFLSPDLAEIAATELNGVDFSGSTLRVSPLLANSGGDSFFPFPSIKAKVFWPRRRSKGCAIVKCASKVDAELIIGDLLNLVVGRPVNCEISNRYEDSVVISGLDRDLSEPEMHDAVRTATNRRIVDFFIMRGAAVVDPTSAACGESLLREIAPFLPSRYGVGNCCRVQVFPPEPKDYFTKAQITFDGRLHLEAAKALDDIQGKVLTGCQPWQKIQCQRTFHSLVSCPAPVYFVIKKQLDILIDSFKRRRAVSCNLERNSNGSYRVKISANATKTVAELRKPLEQLMKGKTMSHASLTPSVLQLLYSRDGIYLCKSVGKETGTHIMFDRQNMSIRIFGPFNFISVAERKLLRALSTLSENNGIEIRLRGRNLPRNLMKSVVEKFGPDMYGLKDMLPGAELTLNIRRHALILKGNKDLKQKIEEIIYEFAKSLSLSEPVEQFTTEAACPICLCEVEDCYQLEACLHKFCRSCLVEQCESAIKGHDGFPICCTFTGCRKPIFLTDLKSLLTSDKLEELFKASLGAFVASNGGTYRFCPSPDCPAVYKVAEPGLIAAPPFICGACSVETCTICHLEYHPYVTCERYKEFKDDPDLSLKDWCKGKEHVKCCPLCGYTIEKIDGCNHISCKCGKHICWVCLECYDSSDDCYAHLRLIHQAIM